MRAGLITSVIAHLVLILWGLFGLPDTKPFDSTMVEALPVDIVPISELTSLQKGKKTADPKKPPAPEQTKKEAEQPTPAPTPAPPKPTPAAPAPSAPPPPAAQPEPPKPPEPTPEPPKAPEPPKTEAPAPTPEPTPAPEPTPEPPKQAEAPPPPAPKPRSKPPAPKPTQTAKTDTNTPSQLKSTAQSKFDADQIKALLDKQKSSGGAQSQQTAGFGAEEARNPTQMMTQSELDALRAQVQRCWNLPVGWTNPAEVTVTIRFKLNQDGTVNGIPSIEQYPASQYGTVAAEGAVRAVLQCGPYQLPIEKYDQWSEVQMRFSPQG